MSPARRRGPGRGLRAPDARRDQRSDWSRHLVRWSAKPPIAQPVSDFRVDVEPPDIHAFVASIAGPYTAGSTVLVDFTCTDFGSGIRWCPVSATLDTTFPGYHS